MQLEHANNTLQSLNKLFTATTLVVGTVAMTLVYQTRHSLLTLAGGLNINPPVSTQLALSQPFLFLIPLLMVGSIVLAMKLKERPIRRFGLQVATLLGVGFVAVFPAAAYYNTCLFLMEALQ